MGFKKGYTPWNKGLPAWNKGLKTGSLSKEHKENISKSNKGKIRSAESKKKYKKHALEQFKNGMPEKTRKKLRKPKSEEHKKNMSLAQKFLYKKGKIVWNKGLKGVMPIPWNKGKNLPKKMRKKISESIILYYKNYPEVRKKISENTKKGMDKKEVRLKLRLAALKKIHGKNGASLGKNEKKILDELEKLYMLKIKRGERIIGYIVDGYISELNLAIEVDEIHHFDFDTPQYIKQ